jgi:DNA invertase Pin-like site-specific DNA recombinase
MDVGYARVSSVGQSLDIQLEALNQAGCEKVFAEKKTGTNSSDRQQLQEAMDFCRAGDTLIVTRLDRLARSSVDLHNIIAGLEAKDIGFRCLQQSGVDTTNSMGKLVLAILGAVAAFETDIRKERQLEGIEKAKANGVYKGRRPSIDRETIHKLKGEGLGATAIASRLNIGRASVYRALMD